MLTSRLIAAAAALGLSADGAYAADIMGGSADFYKDTPGNYWVITLGGYAGAMPDYQGSKGYACTFRPAFDIHQAGQMEWITLPTDAFGLTLYNTANFRIGAAGDWLQNRNSKDDSTLNGLHSINYTVEAGRFRRILPSAIPEDAR